MPKEYRGGGPKWADWKKEYDGKTYVTIYEMVLRSRRGTNIKRSRPSTDLNNIVDSDQQTPKKSRQPVSDCTTTSRKTESGTNDEIKHVRSSRVSDDVEVDSDEANGRPPWYHGGGFLRPPNYYRQKYRQKMAAAKKAARNDTVGTDAPADEDRGSTTISIPIHGLVSKGEVPVIRIRQARNSSNAPFLRMTIPGVIFSDQRTRTKSLRTRFGHDRKWSYFVKTHVEAQARGWKTLDDAQNWVLETDFVDTMNGIWAMLLRNDLVTYARTNS